MLPEIDPLIVDQLFLPDQFPCEMFFVQLLSFRILLPGCEGQGPAEVIAQFPTTVTDSITGWLSFAMDPLLSVGSASLQILSTISMPSVT